MNIHLRHARALRQENGRRMCLSGIRLWCTAYGIDYEALADPDRGIPEEQFAATGDARAVQSIANAREEALSHG